MNCKPGDLAVIVRCRAQENLGRYVSVVDAGALPGSWLVRSAGGPLMGAPLGNQRFFTPCAELNAWDSDLRPIRDNDGEDEILRIAGLPQEVTA